jgi:hypothetical protein
VIARLELSPPAIRYTAPPEAEGQAATEAPLTAAGPG